MHTTCMRHFLILLLLILLAPIVPVYGIALTHGEYPYRHGVCSGECIVNITIFNGEYFSRYVDYFEIYVNGTRYDYKNGKLVLEKPCGKYIIDIVPVKDNIRGINYTYIVYDTGYPMSIYINLSNVFRIISIDIPLLLSNASVEMSREDMIYSVSQSRNGYVVGIVVPINSSIDLGIRVHGYHVENVLFGQIVYRGERIVNVSVHSGSVDTVGEGYEYLDIVYSPWGNYSLYMYVKALVFSIVLFLALLYIPYDSMHRDFYLDSFIPVLVIGEIVFLIVSSLAGSIGPMISLAIMITYYLVAVYKIYEEEYRGEVYAYIPLIPIAAVNIVPFIASMNIPYIANVLGSDLSPSTITSAVAFIALYLVLVSSIWIHVSRGFNDLNLFVLLLTPLTIYYIGLYVGIVSTVIGIHGQYIDPLSYTRSLPILAFILALIFISLWGTASPGTRRYYTLSYISISLAVLAMLMVLCMDIPVVSTTTYDIGVTVALVIVILIFVAPLDSFGEKIGMLILITIVSLLVIVFNEYLTSITSITSVLYIAILSLAIIKRERIDQMVKNCNELLSKFRSSQIPGPLKDYWAMRINKIIDRHGVGKGQEILSTIMEKDLDYIRKYTLYDIASIIKMILGTGASREIDLETYKVIEDAFNYIVSQGIEDTVVDYVRDNLERVKAIAYINELSKLVKMGYRFYEERLCSKLAECLEKCFKYYEVLKSLADKYSEYKDTVEDLYIKLLKLNSGYGEVCS